MRCNNHIAVRERFKLYGRRSMTPTSATLAKSDKKAEPPAAASATLSVGGKTVELPIRKGTVGPSVIDIGKLYAQTGMFTYDPGFTSTASTESQITYIDGDEGVLLYRGYPIDELAEQSSFMEVSYLLLNGELPSRDELAVFNYTISRHTMLHEQLA